MNKIKTVQLKGKDGSGRLSSRVLEELVQDLVRQGTDNIEIEAYGQHGLGGRIFQAGEKEIKINISGSPGQRVGAMGTHGTLINVHGPVSDDVGWLNAGAEIVVHGYACNGACNAMAQGRVYVAGNIGSRGMTMTKYNPRFDQPELWVLGSAGDYFAEFMAGGRAVVCGHNPVSSMSVLGYRPCVGMVGGKIFFRGSQSGYSEADAKLVPVSDEDWQWLVSNLELFLQKISKKELYDVLAQREQWQCLEARTPMDKRGSSSRRSMSDFRRDLWDKELGKGGLLGDLTDLDRTPVSLIATGDLRRYVPEWEHRKYLAPCQASCPSGIPVQQRWELVRQGKLDEALDIALAFTPFPASICGYLCPNLCMQGCTKNLGNLQPVDITVLGKKGANSSPPKLPPVDGKKVAVAGGGPAGISVAWQLRIMGHQAVIFDQEKELGGKMSSAIPEHRIPAEILKAELERVRSVIPHVHLKKSLSSDDFMQLKMDYDFVVLAAGAQKPRTIPIPGNERIIPALTFLKNAKAGKQETGKKVVIIGAGNVGCDVATEAHRLGAEDITLIDIQEPASFGKEREEAEKAGAVFRYPCFTKEVTGEGIVLTTGEVIPADTVIISIGDMPELNFLNDHLETDRGFVVVNEVYQTSDPKVFAIGDMVKPGLLTDAIGAGRKAAQAIHNLLSDGDEKDHYSWLDQYSIDYSETSEKIDYSRMTLEYYDPRVAGYESADACAGQCSSCGSCMDCGLCDALCPTGAITRKDIGKGRFERSADPVRCIGCGFCEGCCPCGIWVLKENFPMG